jgi:hypothetical protein
MSTAGKRKYGTAERDGAAVKVKDTCKLLDFIFICAS